MPLAEAPWAADEEEPHPFGIWGSPEEYTWKIAGKAALGEREWRWIAGRGIRRVFTTGCNIPVFVAAWPEIVAIDKPNEEFEWHNFYDEDDVLGWPLGMLSEGYGRLVRDYEVSAGRWVLGRLFKGWNPLSHGEYWRSEDVVGKVVEEVRSMVVG